FASNCCAPVNTGGGKAEAKGERNRSYAKRRLLRGSARVMSPLVWKSWWVKKFGAAGVSAPTSIGTNAPVPLFTTVTFWLESATAAGRNTLVSVLTATWLTPDPDVAAREFRVATPFAVGTKLTLPGVEACPWVAY